MLEALMYLCIYVFVIVVLATCLFGLPLSFGVCVFKVLIVIMIVGAIVLMLGPI